MATFNVGIGKDDIQEPVLLEEDWYTAEITKDPYEAKNSAWMDVGEKMSLEDAFAINDKVGKNIVVNLRLISDIPEANGRTFTKWLPLPNAMDEGRFMNDGQPRADWKADVIHKWAEAFGAGSEGTDATLNEGAKALIYLSVEKDRQTEKDVNTISMNVDPRPIGEGGLSANEDVLDEGLL